MDVNWIFEANLKPFLEMVASITGAQFDEDYEWVAISYGIRNTDDRDGPWYEFPVLETPPLTLALAQEPGGSDVSIRIDGEQEFPEVAAKLEMLITVCQNYTVISHH